MNYPWTFSLPPLAALVAALALAVAGSGALLRRRSRCESTTLVAVWRWSLASLLAIAAVEIVAAIAAQPTSSWLAPLRLAAATSSFCPTMALLGAKRPQDRGWQFIVAALWGILSLPSLQWLLFGGVREIHPAQLGFLAILVGVGVVNGAATRYGPSSVLYGCGQAALLASYFETSNAWLPGAQGPLIGLALMVAAWGLLAAELPPARREVSPLDRVWLDFRDLYGAAWGLRVMERMNASATMYGWPVQLSWSGFVPRDTAAADEELPPIVADSMRTLLRRFVSPEWIDARLGVGVGTSAT